MLDKELCTLFGIDEFTQYIMKELDYVEDQIYEQNVSPVRYIELKARYEALKEVRDAYRDLKKKNSEETSVNIESHYKS